MLIFVSASCSHHRFLELDGIKRLINPNKKEKPDVNPEPGEFDYQIVGTNQTKFYNNTSETQAPDPGESFYGQDATYSSSTPGTSPRCR